MMHSMHIHKHKHTNAYNSIISSFSNSAISLRIFYLAASKRANKLHCKHIYTYSLKHVQSTHIHTMDAALASSFYKCCPGRFNIRLKSSINYIYTSTIHPKDALTNNVFTQNPYTQNRKGEKIINGATNNTLWDVVKTNPKKAAQKENTVEIHFNRDCERKSICVDDE